MQNVKIFRIEMPEKGGEIFAPGNGNVILIHNSAKLGQFQLIPVISTVSEHAFKNQDISITHESVHHI